MDGTESIDNLHTHRGWICHPLHHFETASIASKDLGPPLLEAKRLGEGMVHLSEPLMECCHGHKGMYSEEYSHHWT